LGSNMDRIISENIELYPSNMCEMSVSITQNWTEQALECYYLDCDCSRCSVGKGRYSFICQMPKVVDTLIKTSGEPEAIRKTA